MTSTLPETEQRSSENVLEKHLNVLAEMQETEHIASFLYVQGCRGIPHEANFCPVAKYLYLQTGKEVVVGVGKAYFLHSHSGVEIPQLVEKFTKEFDSGSHKELRLNPIHSLFIKMYESLARKRTISYE